MFFYLFNHIGYLSSFYVSDIQQNKMRELPEWPKF